MRWLVVLAGVVACDSGKKLAPPEAEPKPAVAAAPADGAVAAVGRPHNSVKLAVVGDDGIHGLLLIGDHVYWSYTDEDSQLTTFRRIARSGGHVEELGKSRTDVTFRGDRNIAVLDGELYVTGTTTDRGRPDKLRASIYKLVNGTSTLFSRGPFGTALSTTLIAHDGKLYWRGVGTTGDGPILVTDKRGTTKTVLTCNAATGDGCAEGLIPGPAPIVVRGDRGVSLLGATITTPAARCPECTMASAIIDDHIVCDPTPAECATKSYMIKLDGTAQVEAPNLFGPEHGGGFFYHLEWPSRTLLRRRGFTSPDETFAPEVGEFAVDDRGVVWLEGDRLYAAPH